MKTQIFNSQCIHGIATQGDGIATQGHGIATQGASDESSKCRVRSVLIWGGRSVRVASTFFSENAVAGHDTLRISCAGPETHCSDWILDGAISPYDPHRDESLPSCMVAVLVTAHDELLICKLQCDQRTTLDGQVQVETLVAGPRSVLYSAHVLWISVTQVLVAAGTVFGEVHLWSFRPKGTLCGSSHPAAHLHHTFQGHEGSIFGVQISSELRFPGSACPQRLLASCSDDRRIRIWRVPNLASTTPVAPSSSGQGSPETCESETLSSQTAGGEIQPKHCVASAWGHASRIWSVHFVPQRRESWLRENNIDIISTGEDATAQRWSLSFPLGTLETSKSFIGPDAQFKHVSTWDCHSGKNIWSAALTAQSPSSCVLVTGGADGMVVSHKIPSEGTTVTYDYASTSISENATANTRGYELPNNGLYNCDQPTSQWEDPAEGPEHKNAFKKPLHLQYQLQALRVKRFKASDLSVDVLKRYVFVDEGHFLVTTEAGQVFVGILRHAHNPDSSVTWQKLSVEASAPFTWTLIARYDDLKSHSILTSVSSYKVAFLGGTNGTLHVYDHESGAIQSFSILRQKISGLFAQLIERPDCTTTKEARVVGLVATTLGSSTAYSSLMQRGKLHGSRSTVSTVTSWKVELPSTFVVTSAQFILSANSLLLGFRNGTLAAYGLTSAGGSINPSACFRRVHGEDAITVILALPQPTGYSEATTTYVLTAGRNGTYSIHRLYSQHDTVSTIKMRLETVHVCAPPIRPNIEGACFHAVSSNLILWGFRGKDFVVWNETKQSETMTIGCGGAHRNWAYLANENEGGSFMWTKASCLNMQWQPQPSYRVIKEGAHGREIKALAISHRLELSGHRPVNLMVTGAEDTNLSFFTLQENAPSRNCSHFRCFGVLKKHKTGVQHLQWCGSAGFLFSGGGTEEFFVWKARAVPCYGIGMVCESECPLLGDIPDLRIMSFHVLDLPPSDAAAISNEASFLVCIVYSDSTIRVSGPHLKNFIHNTHMLRFIFTLPLLPPKSSTYFSEAFTQLAA